MGGQNVRDVEGMLAHNANGAALVQRNRNMKMIRREEIGRPLKSNFGKMNWGCLDHPPFAVSALQLNLSPKRTHRDYA